MHIYICRVGVREILGKLIPKIEAFEGSLTPKGAGSAFMGNGSLLFIQTYINTCIQLKYLATVSALTLCLNFCTMSGLRSMSVSCPEARSILASLNKKANSTNAVYNAPSISSVLNGMRYMDDNITEVRRTLRMMTRRLKATDDEFSAKDLSNAAMVMNAYD